jgi:MFS family permease
MSLLFRKNLNQENLNRENRKTGFRRFAVYVVLFAAVASILFICDNFHVRRLNPFEEIALNNILTAKTDAAGDIYLIDSAMSRIVKLDADGFADYEITGGNAAAVFYNAYDVAVEDEKSLFVHDVLWDSSGMRVAAERILEFDKKSGSLRREMYRLDRSGGNPDSSGLIALSALKFGNGKLWFVEKREDSFAVYSLALGEKREEPVVEHVVPYGDALPTLDDFTLDIEGGRVFFADKSGVIRIFTGSENKNEIKSEIKSEINAELKPELKSEIQSEMQSETTPVFIPVSGISVREFSLPYRLSFDGVRLYFYDIGKRALMRLEDENQAEIVFGGWKGATLYHCVYSKGDLLTLTGMDTVVEFAPDGRELSRVSSLPAGYRILLLRVYFWVSALVLLSSSLLLVAVVIRLVNSGKISGKEALSLAVIASAVSTFIAIAPTILDSVKSMAKDEIMNRLSYVMETSSKILDVAAFAEIKNPQDYNTLAYKKFKRSLNDLVSKSNEWNQRLYCDVFKFRDGVQYSICFLDGTIGAFANPRSLEDSNGRAIAESGSWVKNMNYQDASGTYMYLSGPIYNLDGSIDGGIEIGVELRSLEDSIFALSKDLIVRSLLMLALALFLVSEILENLPMTKIHSEKNEEKEEESDGDGKIPSRYSRPVTFLVYLTFNLSTAFLPSYALKMGESFMGFSPAISAVLPITVSDVMLTAAPLVSPFLIVYLGYRLSFFAGFLLCAAGYAACAAFATIGALIVGMGILGLGAGVLFTLLQTCIASKSDSDQKVRNFSSFTSSSFSGMNCGIMIGGIVAASFSQQTVFSLGSFLWLFVMTAVLFLTRKNLMKKNFIKENLVKERGQPGETTSEVKSAPDRNLLVPVPTSFKFPRGILFFLFLSFLPFTMYSGFMYYLVPVFGSQAGLSDTEVSLIFVFFGVGIMFLGPKITAAVRDETTKISYFLWLALIMELCGILCFASFRSLAAMLVAVFILGSAYGIGNVYFPLYLTEMSEAKTLREGSVMGLYNFTESLGLVAAPMVFSIVFNSGSSLGYYLLASLMFLSSLLYRFVWHNRAEAQL